MLSLGHPVCVDLATKLGKGAAPAVSTYTYLLCDILMLSSQKFDWVYNAKIDFLGGVGFEAQHE